MNEWMNERKKGRKKQNKNELNNNDCYYSWCTYLYNGKTGFCIMSTKNRYTEGESERERESEGEREKEKERVWKVVLRDANNVIANTVC